MSAVLEAGGEVPAAVIKPDHTAGALGAVVRRAYPDLSDPVLPNLGHPELQYAKEISEKIAKVEGLVVDCDRQRRRDQMLLAGASFGLEETVAFYQNGMAMRKIFERLRILDDFYEAEPRLAGANGRGGWRLEVPRRDTRGFFIVTHSIVSSSDTPVRRYYYRARM